MGLLLASASVVHAEIYEVTARTSVNVRSAATTKSKVIGRLTSGQEVDVVSIHGKWAKVRYNGNPAFVSLQFLKKAVKHQKIVHKENTEVTSVTEEQTLTAEDNTGYFHGAQTSNAEKVDYLFSANAINTSDISVIFAGQLGFGWSNFLWNNGGADGDLAYGVHAVLQMDFNNSVVFIPQNWYSELALGYKKLGAASMGINYINLDVLPIGYRFPVSEYSIVAKAGVSLAMPINEVDTDRHDFDSAFQVDVLGGVQFEFKQFGIGVTAEYGFINALKDLKTNKLNTIAIMGTLIYKFGKL